MLFVLSSLSAGGTAGVVITFSLIFFIIGWVSASLYIKKKQESNPPIEEELIRGIYSQCGKKLSETQVLKIMNSLKKQR